ncbi:hypothetical protein MKW98_032546 [Papaver atlanticum]|uniref:Uncharacterized protein n=1 Tax=Papaver atlanticum TaxID=357466 RepID=A0AAD4SWB0_9MAGN|nr:hypothetical protein MKW98_032546 [Papaver atlanticum]
MRSARNPTNTYRSDTAHDINQPVGPTLRTIFYALKSDAVKMKKQIQRMAEQKRDLKSESQTERIKIRCRVKGKFQFHQSNIPGGMIMSMQHSAASMIIAPLAIVVAPRGRRGGVTGYCPNDLVKQVYLSSSKYTALSGYLLMLLRLLGAS